MLFLTLFPRMSFVSQEGINRLPLGVNLVTQEFDLFRQVVDGVLNIIHISTLV